MNNNTTAIDDETVEQELNSADWIIEGQNKWINVAELNNIHLMHNMQFSETGLLYKWSSRGTRGKTSWTPRRNYRDRVRSDQMVLGQADGKAGLREWWPKTTQGGNQTRIHSDQMVLVTARQGGWTRWPVAEELKTKLSSRKLPGSSSLRSDG
jgi:hypothetical protein